MFEEEEKNKVTTVFKLENSINELLVTCRQLTEENLALKEKQEEWLADRSRLLDKNEKVRARLELMISRLKAMELEP